VGARGCRGGEVGKGGGWGGTGSRRWGWGKGGVWMGGALCGGGENILSTKPKETNSNFRRKREPRENQQILVDRLRNRQDSEGEAREVSLLFPERGEKKKTRGPPKNSRPNRELKSGSPVPPGEAITDYGKNSRSLQTWREG